MNSPAQINLLIPLSFEERPVSDSGTILKTPVSKRLTIDLTGILHYTQSDGGKVHTKIRYGD